MGEHKSRFLVKQRAFLKIYLISMAEKEQLYGKKYQEVIINKFKKYGYKPNHSEIYKSLYELIDDGILARKEKVKEGMKYQKVVNYIIKDTDKVKLYKKQLKVELDRCYGLLGQAIQDIYK